MEEMVKAYRLNPFNYLEYVLAGHDLISTERIEELVPWSQEIKNTLAQRANDKGQ